MNRGASSILSDLVGCDWGVINHCAHDGEGHGLFVVGGALGHLPMNWGGGVGWGRRGCQKTIKDGRILSFCDASGCFTPSLVTWWATIECFHHCALAKGWVGFLHHETSPFAKDHRIPKDMVRNTATFYTAIKRSRDKTKQKHDGLKKAMARCCNEDSSEKDHGHINGGTRLALSPNQASLAGWANLPWFASLSASSFPTTPVCPGVHLMAHRPPLLSPSLCISFHRSALAT